MSMTDPVADLLTRIRNGSKAKKNAINVPASNLKREVLRILQENKFVKDVVELPDNRQGMLRVYLNYSKGDEAVLKGIRRVSRPGLRRYFDVQQVRQSTHNTRGMLVLSTSRGVMSNFDAARKGIGGEALLRCW